MHFGWQEVLLIAGIILFLFGAKKIPELVRGLGRGMKEFRKELREVESPEPKDEDKNKDGET